MILYHATTRKHLATIEAEGLDPMKSAGKRKEVYLHTASKRAWAVLHTQRRHKTHDIVRHQGQQFPAQAAHTPLEWALVVQCCYHRVRDCHQR